MIPPTPEPGTLAVHICAPRPEVVRLMRAGCSTCGRRTFQVVAFYEWYGPDGTCLRCGERYNEDGRAERPFCRGWREDSKKRARAFYRRLRALLHEQQGSKP